MDNDFNVICREIAQELDCGMRAFIHKTTGKPVFVPDTDEFPDMEKELWAEELGELKRNRKHYDEIHKWSSSEAFELMTEFAGHLTEDRWLQARLLDSLSGRKPFREFKTVIDTAGVFRQKWFEFKSNWQQEYIVAELKSLISTSRSDDKGLEK